MLFIEFKIKGGIIIEEKVLKIKELVNNEDKQILTNVLNNVVQLGIKKIDYDKNIQLTNVSEYEFELVKCRAILEDEKEVEIYLKMIKNCKIKESIFCYWCTICEEDLIKYNGNISIINKVLITELERTKYRRRIFLTIENNKSGILETGSEVNFIELSNYIQDMKVQDENLEKLSKYVDDDDYVLLVGIKIKKDK